MDTSQGGESRGNLAERVAILEAMLAERLDLVQTLRESEERLRTMLDNSPDTICLVDEHATFLYLNRVIPTRRVEDVVGTNAIAYLDEPYKTEFAARLRAAFERGETSTVEVERKAQGAWYSTRLVPLRHE